LYRNFQVTFTKDMPSLPLYYPVYSYGVDAQVQGVQVAPMYDTSEALLDPQALHLQLTAQATHPQMGLFRTVRSPVSFDGQRALDVRPPPTLGEHNQEIRQSLGLPANPSNKETTP
jgi:crotonobetainyl-CoA:carnitine CoA-transferase CaiB-like acyl-CoA transferase